MKTVVLILLWSLVVLATPADTTLYYREWQAGRFFSPQPLDSLRGGPYFAVTYHNERPLEIRRYDKEGQLVEFVRSQFDQWGNAKVKRYFDAKGKLLKVLQFQVSPDTLRLLPKIMGSDFHPLEKNLLVSITYNKWGREKIYYIKSVNGKPIAHRETKYNRQGLKLEERLVDDLHRRLIILRRYHYDDRTGTVTVREYDGAGRLRSKITLSKPVAEPLIN